MWFVLAVSVLLNFLFLYIIFCTYFWEFGVEFNIPSYFPAMCSAIAAVFSAAIAFANYVEMKRIHKEEKVRKEREKIEYIYKKIILEMNFNHIDDFFSNCNRCFEKLTRYSDDELLKNTSAVIQQFFSDYAKCKVDFNRYILDYIQEINPDFCEKIGMDMDDCQDKIADFLSQNIDGNKDSFDRNKLKDVFIYLDEQKHAILHKILSCNITM